MREEDSMDQIDDEYVDDHDPRENNQLHNLSYSMRDSHAKTSLLPIEIHSHEFP